MRSIRPFARVRGPLAGLAGLGLALLPGCGAAPPPPAAVAPAPPPPLAPPPPPDLSAVPEPAGLMLSGRIGRAAASLATAHAWSKLPMPESAQLTELLTSEAIGPVVDLDQPVDFAIAVSGSGVRMKQLVALSAGVKDPEHVRAALAERYKLVPGPNGVTLIQGLGAPVHKAAGDDDGDRRDDDAAARVCELAPAFGAAPVRLVCGQSDAALGALGPWLTRSATRAAAQADLHLDLRMAPVRSTLRDQRPFAAAMAGLALGRVFRGKAGRAISGPLGGDIVDLLADLEGGTLDATLTPAGAKVSATLRLDGSASLLGRLAAGHPERGGGLPPAFAQLPADADVAFFERGVDEAPLARAREVFAEALRGGLDDDGLSPVDSTAVASALARILPGASVAYASGVDSTELSRLLRAERDLPSDAPAAKRNEALRATAGAVLGWRLLAVEQPAASVQASLRQLADALGRPAVVAALRAHDKETVPAKLRAAPPVKAAGLPAGTTHWTIELPLQLRRPAADARKPVTPPTPVAWHVLVAPDGPRTWIGLGSDEAGLATRLSATLAGKGDRLDGRPELASLREGRVGAALALAPRGLLEVPLELRVLGGGVPWGVSDFLEDLAQSPHKLGAPAVFSVTAQAGGPPSVVVSGAQVPAAAIEDVVLFLLRHGGV